MRELSNDEIMDISGGKFRLRINLGAALGTIAVGILSGGPVGLGYALGAIIIQQGVNSLQDMANGEPY